MARSFQLLGIRAYIYIHGKIIIIIWLQTATFILLDSMLIYNYFLHIYSSMGRIVLLSIQLHSGRLLDPEHYRLMLSSCPSVHKGQQNEITLTEVPHWGTWEWGESAIHTWMNTKMEKLKETQYSLFQITPRVREPWATNVRPDSVLILDYL